MRIVIYAYSYVCTLCNRDYVVKYLFITIGSTQLDLKQFLSSLDHRDQKVPPQCVHVLVRTSLLYLFHYSVYQLPLN